MSRRGRQSNPSPDRDDSIIKMREAGATYQEIAQVTGLTHRGVGYIIKKHRPDLTGYKVDAGIKPKWDEDTRAQIISGREQGKSYKEISETTGVPVCTIFKTLDREAPHLLSRKPRAREPETVKRDNLIVSLRREGSTYKQISRDVGVGKTTVLRVIQKYAPELIENVRR